MLAHILVVDDDPAIVEVLNRFLRRQGYEVSTAFNGAEALEKVKQSQPDLITLGVTMPKMHGLTACRLLKENPQTKRIPIILLTGMDKAEDRTRGFEAGADDYMTKPFDQIVLKTRIRELLQIDGAID